MGLIAGYLGGVTDKVITWVIDFLLSLPFLLFVLALVPIAEARFGPVGWPLGGADLHDPVLGADHRAGHLRVAGAGPAGAR